jgi:hypothetical protein
MTAPGPTRLTFLWAVAFPETGQSIGKVREHTSRNWSFGPRRVSPSAFASRLPPPASTREQSVALPSDSRASKCTRREDAPWWRGCIMALLCMFRKGILVNKVS